ncbi:MAG: hypothetical protein M3506_08205 [Chloroflexota bacterium]|nr:hypothetical protein [Chloroflexota bacterium]
MSQEIIRYIRENRGAYTNEAISRSLLDAGNDPAAIEAAWRAVESGEPQARTARERSIVRTPSFWLTLLGYPAALIGLAILVGYLGAPEYALLLIVAGLGIAGITALGLVIARRGLAVAAGVGGALLLLVLIPFVLLVIVAGICLVSVARM